jgi:hypothetical protein
MVLMYPNSKIMPPGFQVDQGWIFLVALPRANAMPEVHAQNLK